MIPENVQIRISGLQAIAHVGNSLGRSIDNITQELCALCQHHNSIPKKKIRSIDEYELCQMVNLHPSVFSVNSGRTRSRTVTIVSDLDSDCQKWGKKTANKPQLVEMSFCGLQL